MTRAEHCIGIVLQFEGGLVDHPADRGGSTNKGITQITYDAHRREKGLPPQPVQFIADSEVLEIYTAGYWTAAHCYQMAPPVDLAVMDCAVHSGPARSIKFLQQCVGVEDDGICGPATLQALAQCINHTSAQMVAQSVIMRRRKFLQELTMRDPSQRVFLHGWINRCDRLAALIDAHKGARG